MITANLKSLAQRNPYKDDYLNILSFLRPIVARCYVAGGFLTRLIGLEPLGGDIDLFFVNKSHLEFTKHCLMYHGCTLVSESAKLVVLSHNGYPIQLIGIRYYNHPQKIIQHFDFTVCQVVYDFNNLFCAENSLIDIHDKRLVVTRVNESQNAVNVLRRLEKYFKRGYSIDDDNLMIIGRHIINNCIIAPTNGNY